MVWCALPLGFPQTIIPAQTESGCKNNMIFILGGRGFLGSSLVNACRERGLEYCVIGKDEYAEYIGRKCDILINANGNSRKYLSYEAPLEDFRMNVTNVRRSLEDFRYGKYVLFSSVDVYPDSSSPGSTDEQSVIDVARQTPYGFHKFIAEQCVRHRAPRWLILRLSGFVGPNLRKNAVYDVVCGNPLWVDASSEFQYLHTSDLSSMVLQLVAIRECEGEIVNVGAQGTISVTELARMTGRPINVRPGSPVVRCEVALDRLARFCEVPSTKTAVQRFLDEYTAGVQ